MRIKCDYCGSVIDEKQETCSNCGAALNGVKRFAGEQPRTIEELKAWYIARKLPPEEVTRFFIGKDVTEPRAFGIYKDDTGDCVVYKNKSDGTRAVRYSGADEAYAVNELYQKLKSEIADRKDRSATRRYKESIQQGVVKKKINKRGIYVGVYGACMLSIALSFAHSLKDDTPSRGYYQYKNETYYHQNSSWYYYDEDTDDWSMLEDGDVPEEVYSDEDGEYLTYRHEGKNFEESIWYTEDSYDDYDDDWDTDYDWDSGSDWDSGGTDWDSDW